MNEQTQAELAQAPEAPAEAEPIEDVVPLEIRIAAATGLLGAAHKVCQDVLIGLVEPSEALDMVRGQLILALQQLNAVDGLEWAVDGLEWIGDEEESEPQEEPSS